MNTLRPNGQIVEHQWKIVKFVLCKVQISKFVSSNGHIKLNIVTYIDSDIQNFYLKIIQLLKSADI